MASQDYKNQNATRKTQMLVFVICYQQLRLWVNGPHETNSSPGFTVSFIEPKRLYSLESMWPIYFHLTSPEFVGSITMETIQKYNVNNLPPTCSRPSLSARQGAEQLWGNAKQQYLKCTQSQRLEKQSIVSFSKHWLPPS